MNRIFVAVCATVAGFSAPRALDQQTVSNIPPVAPTIAKAYDKDPQGGEFYNVFSLTIEPVTGAIWLKSGEGTDPPTRVDRKTGVAKTVGRNGSGPDEYRVVTAIVPGPNGEVGMWDSMRHAWFWVDSIGHQRRTWALTTNNGDPYHTFTDVTGNVYIGQPISMSPGGMHSSVRVRLDSAAGLRDTMRLPFATDARWIWNYSRVTSNSRSTYSTGVMYAPRVMWGVDRKGRLFAASSDSNFVLIRDGKTDRRLMLPVFHEPLTSDDRADVAKGLDEFEASAKRDGAQLQGPRPPAPDAHPTIDGIHIELNGGIAVERSKPCAQMPEWRAPGTRATATDPKARCSIVERFDADGRRLRPFTLTQQDRLWVLRADTAWVTRRNADGLEKILEFVIPKG